MSSPALAPTQVLILSEIGGLLEACKASVSEADAEFCVYGLEDVSDETLHSYEVILADPPTFASSGVADRCAGGEGGGERRV